MLDDLDAAGRWVDDWESAVKERAAKARALSDQVAGLRATARDRDGLIEVTIGASGAIVDLKLDERVRQQPAAETARQIMATIGTAQAELTAAVSQASAEAYGADSATTASITESYRQRFQARRA